MVRKSWTAKGKVSLVWIAGRRLSAAGTVFICAVAPALSASVYTLYDLGTGGMTSSSSSGINSSGQVTGAVYQGGASSAFLTGPDGNGMTLLPFGIGWAVNDHGQVAGATQAEQLLGDNQAILTGFNGAPPYNYLSFGLNTPFGSIAFSVNSSGQVAGVNASLNNGYEAFLTGPNGSNPQDLGFNDPNIDSAAYGVNARGEVTGSAGLLTGQHAFLARPNGIRMRELNDLGASYSWGNALNDRGQVAGELLFQGAPGHANGEEGFVTGPEGQSLIDIGAGTYAAAINSGGVVVGQSDVGTAAHAFIYVNGKMIDLNGLTNTEGDVLNQATGINDAGQICGNMTTASGVKHAFLLSPVSAVPEPRLGGLVGLALLGWVLARRRRVVS